MNINGKLKTWGDKDFARKLVKFANIEVTPGDRTSPTSSTERPLALHPGDFGTEKTKDYSPDVTGATAERIVSRQRHSRKPFFVWWSPAAPHREDVATTILGRPGPTPPGAALPPALRALRAPRPPSFNDSDPADPDNLVAKLPKMTDAQIHQLELDYQGRLGSLLAVDDHVAKLVRILKRTDQYRNTLIVFVSDNGWVQGQHRILGDKFTPYEESIHVPFILSGPGIPKDRTISKQVSNIDFASTLLDAAGAKPGRVQDGISLLPMTRHPDGRRAGRSSSRRRLRCLPADGFPMSYDKPYTG